MITTLRRAYAVLGAIALVAFVVSIADSLFVAQHPCEQCGVDMCPFEEASSIYKCLNCGFMVDEAFQR